MKKLHFPHISRLFSANKSVPIVLTICWSVLAACIIINVRISSAYSSTIQKVEETIVQKNDETLTFSLSDRFKTANIPTVAQELRTAFETQQKKTPSNKNILGSQAQTLEYWKNVIAEKPDYRDAYLEAAKNALISNNTKEAHVYIKQVLEIDPNNKTALVLKTVLEKSTGK